VEVIRSAEDLMARVEQLTPEESVCQVLIAGKGQVTIVLQGSPVVSIEQEARDDANLATIIAESREAYRNGKVMTTDQVLRSLGSDEASG